MVTQQEILADTDARMKKIPRARRTNTAMPNRVGPLQIERIPTSDAGIAAPVRWAWMSDWGCKSPTEPVGGNREPEATARE